MNTSRDFSPRPDEPPSYPVQTQSTVSATEVLPAAPIADPQTEAVIAALAQKPPERTWIQSLVLLVVTLAIFASTGLFNSTPADIAMLVGVLLFHELGHYLGMRLFNYQDVKMFFIPFFGAAVSGRATSVAGYKEAIVLLLGPVPGIILGVVLGAVCMFRDLPQLRQLSMLLLALNAFNLLPLLPLDGGRLVQLIIFSRQRHVEALFRVLMAVLLGLLALAMRAWLLALVAVFMLIGTRANYLIAWLAHDLRGLLGPLDERANVNPAAGIPRELAVPLVQRVRAAFPAIQAPSPLAGLARQVWERMHLRPPGLVASLPLLAIHAAAFLGTPLAFLVFLFPLPSTVSTRRPKGTVVNVHEIRAWGRLREATELAPDGRQHGRHFEYDPLTGKLRVEGQFKDNEPAGEWTYYDEQGQVTRREIRGPE